MNVLKIAKSYVFSKNKTKLTKVHSYIAMIGIIIGVTALIVVSSAMNGFSHYMYSNLELHTDVSVIMERGTTTKEKKELIKEINSKDYVESIDILNYYDVFVKNIKLRLYVFDEEDSKKYNIIEDKLNITSELKFYYFEKIKYAILDIYKSNKNKNINLDDLLDQTVIDVVENKSLNTNYRSVVMSEKTFKEHFFVDLKSQKRVELLIDIDDIFKTKSFEYLEENENVYDVNGWHEKKPSLYQTLQLEQTVIKIVLFFIILVSCFNIVSTLTLIITEKKQDIFVLKTIGYSDKNVLLIFLLTGAWIGLFGLILGTIFGILITVNLTEILYFIENIMGLKFIPEGIAMFPYKLNPIEIININILTALFIFISCVLPSMNTLSINPAEGLKDE